MAQEHFTGDPFKTTIPYLDGVSRARLPEVSRSGTGNHELCRPSANVFRTPRVNHECPPYATTFNATTGCCENTFTTNNPSDLEFLRALRHAYIFHNPAPNPSLKIVLQQIIPEVSSWFDSGQSSVIGAAAVPPPPYLTLNTTRDWFPLIMKFFIRLRPSFRIQAHDPVTNTINLVHAHGNVEIDRNAYPALSTSITSYIQEVGAESVKENFNSATAFTPVPLRCRRHHVLSANDFFVDMTSIANIVSDPGCGLRGNYQMSTNGVGAVPVGISWKKTLVDIFMAMFHRGCLEEFDVAVRYACPSPVLAGMVTVPDATGTLGNASQTYQPVVDSLLERLPGNSWFVFNHPYSGSPQHWSMSWSVHSDAYDRYGFELRLSNSGKLRLRALKST